MFINGTNRIGKFFTCFLILFILSGCTSENNDLTSNEDISHIDGEVINNNQVDDQNEPESNQEPENLQPEAPNVQGESATLLGLEAVTVSRVVDGDTFVLSDGRKVRLIGVNTPESTNRNEEYGKEASQFTSSKLTGKQIWIQKMFLKPIGMIDY